MKNANEFRKEAIQIMRSQARRVKELREKSEALSAQARDTAQNGPDKVRRLKDEAAAAHRAMLEAMDAAKSEVQAACKAYAQEIDTGLNPAELTDDVKLLNCGAPLDERDLHQMAARNSGNRTMTRLIENYARQHNIRFIAPASEEREAIETMQGTAAILFKQRNYAAVETMVDRVFGPEE